MLIGTEILTGNSNPELAKDIAVRLGMDLGKLQATKFSDGEINVEITHHVRGIKCFVVQSTCNPTNDNLMELLLIIDALKRSSAKKVFAVMPYYGYARQDRRPGFLRTPISSRVVADMLEAVGLDFLIVMDIHSAQQVGFFSKPVVNVSPAPEIVGDIFRKHGNDFTNVVIVSPDPGGIFRARTIAKQLDNADLAIIDKRRERANTSEVMNVIGTVKDKHCIIVDDMVDTAGTLCKAAIALMEKGATKVSAYCTHGILSGNAHENINESPLEEVVVTNTIPQTHNNPKIRVLSVAGLLAETIRRVVSKQSISQLFHE